LIALQFGLMPLFFTPRFRSSILTFFFRVLGLAATVRILGGSPIFSLLFFLSTAFLIVLRKGSRCKSDTGENTAE
jgi:hypothetical protein